MRLSICFWPDYKLIPFVYQSDAKFLFRFFSDPKKMRVKDVKSNQTNMAFVSIRILSPHLIIKLIL